jgi:hypothetical protein
MRPLISLGIALVVLWMLAVIVFKVVGFLIHLVLIAAAVLIIAGLVRRGANRVGL